MNKLSPTYIRWFDDLDADDVPEVGGKNASLGEMLTALQAQGVRVPDGFATTAVAYRRYVSANELEDKLRRHLDAWHAGDATLQETGRRIRRLFRHGEFPDDIAAAIRHAYTALSERYDMDEVDVAARSSATAEDLPEASFAGQQESFLNITGPAELLEACRKCYASLFTDRAITYREEQGFDHLQVALSVGVQKMVRADKAGSGVMFTLDTETGFRDVVVINAAWGLGENVVQGSVTPDEYRVFKPLLDDSDTRPIITKRLGDKAKKMVYTEGSSATTKNVETSQRERRRFVLDDDQILRLARWARAIESYYERPMDIEWAQDGLEDVLYIVQARPETVQSQKEAAQFRHYELKEEGERLVSGLAIGQGIATGPVCIIEDTDEIDRFEQGAILVTGMTDPDWVPIMKQAAGIITDHGGRTRPLSAASWAFRRSWAPTRARPFSQTAKPSRSPARRVNRASSTGAS